MKPNQQIQEDRHLAGPNTHPHSKGRSDAGRETMSNSHPVYADETDASFFAEPIDPSATARVMASEVICRLLIWAADGRTLEDRGLRASIALYCIRPDLIDGATLDQIGTLAGCSRQAVHKLAISFRQTISMQE